MCFVLSCYYWLVLLLVWIVVHVIIITTTTTIMRYLLSSFLTALLLCWCVVSCCSSSNSRSCGVRGGVVSRGVRRFDEWCFFSTIQHPLLIGLVGIFLVVVPVKSRKGW